jgi:hypothetical protein
MLIRVPISSKICKSFYQEINRVAYNSVHVCEHSCQLFLIFNLQIRVPLVLCPTFFTYFCFNVPCLYTTLLNLHPLIFGLTPFVWLRFITLSLTYFITPYVNIVFYLPLFNLRPHFIEQN